jgi:hypothetical protein
MNAVMIHPRSDAIDRRAKTGTIGYDFSVSLRRNMNRISHSRKSSMVYLKNVPWIYEILGNTSTDNQTDSQGENVIIIRYNTMIFPINVRYHALLYPNAYYDTYASDLHNTLLI